MNPLLRAVICLECGASAPPALFPDPCPRCGSTWLEAAYDLDAVASRWTASRPLADRPASLWRYGDLLPLDVADPAISQGEGGTPLTHLVQYERAFAHPGIYVKDERQNPTGSFKDRQAALVVSALVAAGIRECVLASTGNAAAAYAAYCARAGIRLWLFVTSAVPSDKTREAALYGAEVIQASTTYDETKHIAAEFARRQGLYFDRGARTIPGKEAMKTIAFEIAEQFARQTAPDRAWHAPDWYIQAVSGGIGPLGVAKGFRELAAMGLIDRPPKMGIVQVAGCAPMVTAWEANRPTADPVVPNTLISVLATGDPGHSYIQLKAGIDAHGGAMIAVDDGEAFAGMRRIAREGGLSVEPAAAVAFAGLEKMLRTGVIAPGETVVVNCSGHTFPAESHVLGDRYAISLEAGTLAAAAAEGLTAVFDQIHEQVTTVLVVDDTASDRRLIRRLLERYKRYRILEADNGEAGLIAARSHHPDLIVADLTMPVMDGFTLVERLKADPAISAIPVIVVSAKHLSEGDRAVLDKWTESVWTKGDYRTRDLVDHIVDTLGDKPVDESGTPAEPNY